MYYDSDDADDFGTWFSGLEAEEEEDDFGTWYELSGLDDEYEEDDAWYELLCRVGIKIGNVCLSPSDYDGKPPSQIGSKLFVRNLAKSVNVQQLTALFAHFGTIARVNIIKDALGISKGFGFVRFKNVADARKALGQMNGHLLAGRKLQVALAHPPKWGSKGEAGKK